MKYRSQWHTFIFRSNVQSYWLIILKYDVHTSNSLQDIRQNHWPMKYRSQWPTFILRSHVRSNWLVIPSVMFIHQIALISRLPMWVMMVQHKTSDQYLTSGKVSTRSIHRFKRHRLLKSLTRNFNIFNNANADADADAVVTAIALPVFTYSQAKKFSRYLADKFKMPKFARGHSSGK